jgi:dienelactone hydrolase
MALKKSLFISFSLLIFLTLPVSAQRARLVVAEGGMPQWKEAPAYAKDLGRNVLQRSVFFLPMFGAVYKEKFEALLPQLPKDSLRGIVIHNHGCGGMWSLETDVAQFYYQQGFAVITPEFVTRAGNKVGCPGGSEDEMRQRSGERGREGIYQAVNPARLAARAHDVMTVVQWLKGMTSLPIILSGHSEGCRTVYSMHLNDPQMVGGACIKQGLQKPFEHTWRWNPQFPMWQSLEEFDPWVVFPEGTRVQDVTFEAQFKSTAPQNLTIVIVPGKTHWPLNQEAERASLRQWLNQRVAVPHVAGQNGFNYESALPAVQGKLKSSP